MINKKAFDLSKGIKKDVTLYAKWEKDYTVVAVAGGVGGTAGLSTIATILGVVIHKKRKK